MVEKKQIILCHTSREVEDYLTSLRLRYNGKYNKIPHFLVDRKGEVSKLLDVFNDSIFFDDDSINQNSIIVVLENLGWLEKKPLSNKFINWIGNIYEGEVYEKKWRDYIYWQPYTDSQLQSTAKLCNFLVEELNLEDFVVTHNTKIPNIEKVNGIVTRSNFDTIYTDLNPSFKFENFIKLMKYEYT